MTKKLFLLITIFCLWSNSAFAALVEGTNCGFVTVAPTTDPGGVNLGNADDASRSGKFVAPANGTITEIGWYCENATEEANFEVGLYSDDGGGATSLPENLAAGSDTTNAKGTDAGWKVTTGLSIPIVSGTTYWIATQLDATATDTIHNGQSGSGRRSTDTTNTTALGATWGATGATTDNRFGIYAKYTPTRRIIVTT